MTPTERTGFRKILIAKKAELEKGSLNRGTLAIETSPEELDRIQNAQERDLAIDALDRDFTLLREVQTALKRIDTNTFGVCVNCEENISYKRLAAIPWAELCIECQENADRKATESSDDAASRLASAA